MEEDWNITPRLQKDETRPLISASNDVIPTTGTTDLKVTVTTEDGHTHSQVLPFTVTDELDILGTNAINSLQLTILNNPVKVHVDNILTVRSDQHLQQSCLQICKEFPDLWKQELGRLKDYQLEVKFKPDVTPRFCKPRTVPFAVQEDLNQRTTLALRRASGNQPSLTNTALQSFQYVNRVYRINQHLRYEFVATTLYSSMRNWKDTVNRCHYQRIS